MKTIREAAMAARRYGPKPFIVFQYGDGLWGWALEGSPLARHILGIKRDAMFDCYENPRLIEHKNTKGIVASSATAEELEC